MKILLGHLFLHLFLGGWQGGGLKDNYESKDRSLILVKQVGLTSQD